MKTYSQKPASVERVWYVLNASETTLGRVSTVAAGLLLGKGKPTVTPHTDGGDFVIIINAEKVKLTGGKETKKMYYRHSGFPGGIYQRSLREQRELDSTKILHHAIRGMLPVNKLRDGRLARLKIYKDADHTHAPQQPEVISLKGKK